MADTSLRVLWATDGSARSQDAIPLLRQMVLPVAARLTVLAVAPHSLISPARPDPAFLTRANRTARKRALLEARELAEREATILDPGVETEVLSIWGHPIEEILKTASKIRADLIVMAAKGHSNLHLVFMGSVSQGVAQHTTRPLLIARPGTASVRKVVLGYHGTASARKALTFLGRLALPDDAEVVLFTAIEPFTMPEGMPLGYRQQAIAEAHKINDRRHQAAERALQSIAEQVRTSGRQASTEVDAGPAAQLLDAAARKHEADLIVLGSRRPAPERHYLLGSTAEKLVRHSHTSVLVVR
jgi:nucleotide-binding universal stress UspA family protein